MDGSARVDHASSRSQENNFVEQIRGEHDKRQQSTDKRKATDHVEPESKMSALGLEIGAAKDDGESKHPRSVEKLPVDAVCLARKDTCDVDLDYFQDVEVSMGNRSSKNPKIKREY